MIFHAHAKDGEPAAETAITTPATDTLASGADDPLGPRFPTKFVGVHSRQPQIPGAGGPSHR